ncbi:MAG: bifunctional 3-deoxy-7-phosphoheptulonate synthase/chorismate mutase type II [Bacteroidales bacterium]|nr:bifunctional 3-deoxy-7-phosphoheptulonate synthase/chorismate mutase type II [Bacteroidales bacterium]
MPQQVSSPTSPLLTPRPLLIAGPCSAESERQVLTTAENLRRNTRVQIFRAGVWKPRTKPGGFEGIGAPALQWLVKARQLTGMPIATEVAVPRHVEATSDCGIDLLWIGARTSADPFAMQELAETIGRLCPDTPVLVKNPVVADIELWIGAIERLRDAGVKNIGAIHRGFRSLGHEIYRNHPRWSVPLELHRRMPQLPLISDPSHIGGRRDLIAPLAQKAMDMGFDGLIIETHPEPDVALSDKDQQITPHELSQLLDSLQFRSMRHDADEPLREFRLQIDQLDAELLEILSRRMVVSQEIGCYKRRHGIPVVQTERYENVLLSRIASGEGMGMSSEFIGRLFALIHEESIQKQL